MSKRLLVHEVDPAATAAVKVMSNYVRESGLDAQLNELVKIRASQINGCAYCLDLHNRDARAAGEDQRRLDVLSAWREAESLYSARERAALAFTEAVTLIADDGVSDDLWDEVARCFEPAEIVQLLMAISTINVYNRLAVATHRPLRGASSAAARR
jgi:AhpD family alkylhydroperoxidase